MCTFSLHNGYVRLAEQSTHNAYPICVLLVFITAMLDLPKYQHTMHFCMCTFILHNGYVRLAEISTHNAFLHVYF